MTSLQQCVLSYAVKAWGPRPAWLLPQRVLSSSIASQGPSHQHRTFSEVSGEEAIAAEQAFAGDQADQDRPIALRGREFGAARGAFNSQLRDLRKQWAEEHRRKVEAKEARAAAARVALERDMSLHEKEEETERQERAAQHATRVERLARVRAEKDAMAAAWRKAVSVVYSRYKEHRRTALVLQSRNWIRRKDLDARIEEALDNPVPLYEVPSTKTSAVIQGNLPSSFPEGVSQKLGRS